MPSRTHGLSRSRIFYIHNAMKRRCQEPTDPAYPRYGGRGIKVCERWQSFESFYADMGERPPGTSLDRIDNDGPYSPENCRWASIKEQNRNTRHLRILELNGERRCLTEWAERLGISRATLSDRICRGWPVAEALSPHKKKAGRRKK